MTALAVRATGRHRHHAPRKPGPLRRLKQRLMDHNDRMLRDMARQLEEQTPTSLPAPESTERAA